MENFTETTIEKVKNGEYFKRRPDGQVYVKDGYNRSTKKYYYHSFEDINRIGDCKKGTEVIINFTF